MRLDAEAVRRAILDVSPAVRDMAVAYFSEGACRDLAVMPQIARAIDKYGWKHAISLDSFPDDLPQSPETIQWILAKLAKTGSIDDAEWPAFCDALSLLLCSVDAQLLSKYEKELTSSRGLAPDDLQYIQERTALLNADPEACWNDVTRFCQANQDRSTISQLDLERAILQIEAIARSGDRFAEQAISILSSDSESIGGEPAASIEAMMALLVGELRLEAAVPPLVRRLALDNQFADQCVESLINIGSDVVVEELASRYHDASQRFRFDTIDVLTGIHTDRKVSVCRELLEYESDNVLRIDLAAALLTSLATAGVESARHLILSQPPSEPLVALRGQLVVAATLLGEEFPELPEWRDEITQDETYRSKFHNPEFPVFDSIGTLTSPKTVRPDASRIPQAMFRRRDVGRNQPCPCGSGKKYKKCCMRA